MNLQQTPANSKGYFEVKTGVNDSSEDLCYIKK